jgi:hypothetical protein
MELPLWSERERKKERDRRTENDKTGNVAFLEYSSIHSKVLQ